MQNSFKKNHVLSSLVSLLLISISLILSDFALGQAALPGTDQFDKMTAAGDLLRIIDSAMFTYGARLLAGLAVLGAGWSLKEHKFILFSIGIVAAIIIATIPMWVQNLFDIGGGSIFN